MEGTKLMTNVEALGAIWQALHTFREDVIPEGETENDSWWGDICEAMAHLHETLDVEQSEID
jgi:hypothetical protein